MNSQAIPTERPRRSMTPVYFSLTVQFDARPKTVWDELIDWKGHEKWIPATRVDLHTEDPLAIGATFTATTGYGPLALEDRMELQELKWSDDDQSGFGEVEKLGPILRGRARFIVEPSGSGAQVEWIEDVAVPHLPKFLAPTTALIGAAGFRFAMWRLKRRLDRGKRSSSKVE